MADYIHDYFDKGYEILEDGHVMPPVVGAEAMVRAMSKTVAYELAMDFNEIFGWTPINEPSIWTAEQVYDLMEKYHVLPVYMKCITKEEAVRKIKEFLQMDISEFDSYWENYGLRDEEDKNE